MNLRHDGSTIDLERELIRYMIERRITRRELLERIGKVGAAAALAPVIAACTSSGGASPSPSSAASVAASASASAAAGSPTAAASVEPTP